MITRRFLNTKVDFNNQAQKAKFMQDLSLMLDDFVSAINSLLVDTQTDVTSSRTLGTVYQNTSQKPLHVAVSCTGSGATIEAFSDAAATPSVSMGKVHTVSSASGAAQLSFIVLPGNYYKVTGGTKYSWIETI